ncbi:MAG: GNAT family N-acetyltransferase [Bermanella sp.]
MNLKVLTLSKDDREEWEHLYIGYAEFYNMPMNNKILDTVWSWIFDETNKFHALIAKNDEGKILGLMHFRETPSPIRGAVIGFLDDLYIYPEYRGQGVVDSLFSALNDFGKSRGWPFIRWITADDNYRGRGFYDKIAQKTQWLTYQKPVN